jgi:hypothetical protein
VHGGGSGLDCAWRGGASDSDDERDNAGAAAAAAAAGFDSRDSGGVGGGGPCPRLVRRLLARKDELLSLRASRRAHAAAAEAVLRHAGKKHALTKLERQELRDVRARLKALLGPDAAAASGGGGEGEGSTAPGSVTIGLATLDQLWDAGGPPRPAPRPGGAAPSPVALTPAEALVHECLSEAGLTLDARPAAGGV